MAGESRQVEALELARKGCSPRDIAYKLDIPVNTVYAINRRARARGEYIPPSKAGRPAYVQPHADAEWRQIVIRYHTKHVGLVREAAEARGIAVKDLIEKIMAVTLEHDMIDNILDDEDERADNHTDPALSPLQRMIQSAQAESKAAHIK